MIFVANRDATRKPCVCGCECATSGRNVRAEVRAELWRDTDGTVEMFAGNRRERRRWREAGKRIESCDANIEKISGA